MDLANQVVLMAGGSGGGNRERNLRLGGIDQFRRRIVRELLEPPFEAEGVAVGIGGFRGVEAERGAGTGGHG